MMLDVAKFESMMRDALDEGFGLEMMLVTARAMVRRDETSFSWKLLVLKRFGLDTQSLRLSF